MFGWVFGQYPCVGGASEYQLQSELNLAGCGSRRGGRDDSEVGRSKIGAGPGEVRSVSQVECLHAELHSHGLADIEQLEYRDIHTALRRAEHLIPPFVAQRALGLLNERAGVEPLLQRWIR